MLAEIALDDVAGEAGVSVQTVLRRFGNRAGLIEAATRTRPPSVAPERQTPVGDVAADVDGARRPLRATGRRRRSYCSRRRAPRSRSAGSRRRSTVHRDWVATFRAVLPARRPHRRAVDLLVVTTDVYTWKQLRRDRG